VTAARPAGFDPGLHDELVAMLARDQSGRTGGPDAEGDAARTARLAEILDDHGWPTYDLVGEDGEDAVASTKVVCDGPGDQRAFHVEAATA
jgi:hypothetical protein